MYGFFLVYAETFAVTLVWVEILNALRRRGRFASRFGGICRDLFPYATFLLLLFFALPERCDVVWGLAACLLLIGGGGLAAEVAGLRSRPLVLLELIGCLYVAYSGILIQFFSSPLGGYLYLDRASLPLTALWLFAFAQFLKLANRLSGLFSGLIALFSYLVIGALLTQRVAQPGAAMLAVALAGATTCIWLTGFRFGLRRQASPAASLWAVTAAVVSVVSTSKRVALISLLTPLLLTVSPLIFFTVFITFSYFGPNLRRSRDRLVYRWNLTNERLVNVVMIFCLMGNLILLSHLFVDRPAWTIGLILVALTVFFQTARFILIKGRNRDDSGTRVETVKVLGTPFLCGGMPAAVERIGRFLDYNRGGRYVITPDALALLTSVMNEEYSAALAEADLVVPDGAGVVWAGDLLTEKPALERIPGIELMDEILRLSAERRLKIYLLGTRADILDAASREIAGRHRGLEIAGTRDGFFSEDEEEAVVEQIAASGADVLFVAMGVPKQELFMYRYRRRLGQRLMIGVGGALDVMAGQVDRAPKWLQNLGLEWLHRLIREPKRIKRICLLPLFVLEVLRQKVKASSL